MFTEVENKSEANRVSMFCKVACDIHFVTVNVKQSSKKIRHFFFLPKETDVNGCKYVKVFLSWKIHNAVFYLRTQDKLL